MKVVSKKTEEGLPAPEGAGFQIDLVPVRRLRSIPPPFTEKFSKRNHSKNRVSRQSGPSFAVLLATVVVMGCCLLTRNDGEIRKDKQSRQVTAVPKELRSGLVEVMTVRNSTYKVECFWGYSKFPCHREYLSRFDYCVPYVHHVAPLHKHVDYVVDACEASRPLF